MLLELRDSCQCLFNTEHQGQKSLMQLNNKRSFFPPSFDISPNNFNNPFSQLEGYCGIYGGNYAQMKCHNITLNNSQGHPGKEGPSGEKGHLVSFITLFALFSHSFPSCCRLDAFA